MKYLVIYNTQTGDIVMMSTLRDESEPLSYGFVVEVPDGKVLKSVDVTDPNNPEPVFEDAPVDPVPSEITNLQLALIEMDERVSALEEAN